MPSNKQVSEDTLPSDILNLDKGCDEKKTSPQYFSGKKGTYENYLKEKKETGEIENTVNINFGEKKLPDLPGWV